MSSKFLLFGVDVGGNYGVDAIVMGTDRIIHQHFHNSEVWLPATGWRKKDYSHILGNSGGIIVKDSWMDVRLAYFFRRICEKSNLLRPKIVPSHKMLVKKADYVLSIGGDLYTFAGKEKNWPFPYPIIEAGNEIIRQGKPYIIFCASVGPFDKAGDRLGEIINHLKMCRAIIVREQESFIYLRETIGLKDNVYLSADPAFVMEPEPFDAPFLNPYSKPKLIAINFSLSPIEHVYGHTPINEIYDKLILCVRQLLDNLSVRLVFVPHVTSDHTFLTHIFNAVNKHYPGKVWILPEDIGARKTKWAISQANVLLTMRFHCALAGFSTSTPTMILVSTAKGEKICKEIYGDLEYSLNIRDMNSDMLIPKIRRLLDHEETIRARLKPVCEKMIDRAFGAGDVIAKIL